MGGGCTASLLNAAHLLGKLLSIATPILDVHKRKLIVSWNQHLQKRLIYSHIHSLIYIH